MPEPSPVQPPAANGAGDSRLESALRRGSLILGGFAIAFPFFDSRAWPVSWVGLVPLFATAPRAATLRRAFVDGWLMGLATNVPAFYWLVATMNRFGGFPLPVSLGFYAVLSAYSAVQFGLVAAALQRVGPSAPMLVAPLVWTTAEFFFPNLFPWRLAHSQRDVLPLLQLGDLTGPYGLSFVMAWTSGALARLRSQPRGLLGPATVIILVVCYGSWRIRDVEARMALARPFSVGIIQGNLSLDEKRHTARFEANIDRYRRLSAAIAPPPDLLVWPETVVEWGIPHDHATLGKLDPYPGAPAPLIFGALSYHDRPQGADWFNSAFLRRVDGSIGGLYDKIVLMPFGEFLPFGSTFPILYELSPASGNFVAGTSPGILQVSDELRVAPLICYEDLPASLSRRAVAAGATVLLTLANDAWFGDTIALKQHETLALWRAIENRRYLVRATNTGLTAAIDPLGRVFTSLPTSRSATLRADVRPLTSITIYQRVGDLFGYAVALCALLLLAKSIRSRSRAALH